MRRPETPSLPLETEIKLGTIEELTAPEDLVDFVVATRSDVLESEDERRRVAEMSVQLQRAEALEDGTQDSYFAIRDSHKKIAVTGKLTVTTTGGEKQGYLSALTVSPELRGKGLAKKITDVRIEAAKKAGCTSVYTRVDHANTPSLVSKLNDGFVITELPGYAKSNGPGDFFLLTKRINGEEDADREKGPVGELKEVNLSNGEELSSLLNRKEWVGIDLKNNGPSDSKNPEDWTLILEKITPQTV